MDPKWLNWAQRLQAIAHNGMHYNPDGFEFERYKEIEKVSVEMMADQTDLDENTILKIFKTSEDYQTPKIDTRAAIFKDDKIMLVREKSDGCWTLPGGWADVGMKPTENVIREVWEESGYKVQVNRLVAVYDRAAHPHTPPYPFHIYKMFFLCEIIGGKATNTLETDGVEFYAKDNIPELSKSRNLPFQIAKMFEYHKNPNLPVYCD